MLKPKKRSLVFRTNEIIYQALKKDLGPKESISTRLVTIFEKSVLPNSILCGPNGVYHKKRYDKKFTCHIPEDLLVEVSRVADLHYRSLASHLNCILDNYFLDEINKPKKDSVFIEPDGTHYLINEDGIKVAVSKNGYTWEKIAPYGVTVTDPANTDAPATKPATAV